MTIWFHSMSLSSIPKRTRWGYKNDYLPVEIYFKITTFALFWAVKQGYNALERASRTSPAIRVIWAEYGGHSSSCYIKSLEVALSHVQSMFTSTSFFCLTIYDAAFDYHVLINDVINLSNMSAEEEELGERWKKFKSESWERTNYTSKFQVLLLYILLCGWNLTTRLNVRFK